METITNIPVVDFSSLSLGVSDDELNSKDVESASAALVDAFTTVGFAYLKNTGIPFALADRVNRLAKSFHTLEPEVKEKYFRKVETHHGWVPMEHEGVDPSVPGDLKECFNVTPRGILDKKFPNQEKDLSGFEEAYVKLFSLFNRLAHRVLRAITVGLKLEDQDYLSRCHNTMTKPTGTTMRSLYYPPIAHETKPGQMRLGEHSDYGTFTLLIQDDIGGLQVKTRNGQWIDAEPISDTVLVNIADLLQRWTADVLISTKHRIQVPVNEYRLRTPRQSIAFFFHPDSDTIVAPLDGSRKYEPIGADDFLAMRLKSTYKTSYGNY